MRVSEQKIQNPLEQFVKSSPSRQDRPICTGAEPAWGQGVHATPTPRNSIGCKGEGGGERGKEEVEEGGR